MRLDSDPKHVNPIAPNGQFASAKKLKIPTET